MAFDDIDWGGLAGKAADVAVTALVSGALVLGVLKATGNLNPPAAALQGSQVVVFDIVKYTNAQRAVASKMLGGDSAVTLESGALIMSVSAKVKSVITEIAGEGRVVLVRQAVIHGDAPDITDAVLVELGLPLDVPTSTPSDVLSANPGGSWLLSRKGVQARAEAPRSPEQASPSSTAKLLP